MTSHAITRWNLVVHGGSGVIERARLPAADAAAARVALTLALATGGDVLDRDGDALDAVEAAVRVLEDDPCFNAARGAVFADDGTNRLDAAIMAGHDRRAGAVADTTTTRHPVSLARAVLDHSPHVMLSGAGADAFGRAHGLEPAPSGWFATPERRRQFDEFKAGGGGFDIDLKYGTVGAVALDRAGHVAAATSTGGLTGKRWGRIGDSALIGAGTYADDRAGAVSATGAGEFFIRAGVAHEICARVRFKGEDVVAAAAAVLAEVAALGGTGGVIVIGPHGDGGWHFTTPGMYRGQWREGDAAHVAIFGDE